MKDKKERKERIILNLYTAKEIIEQDHTYFRKVERSKDYIPVKIFDSKTRYAFKIGKSRKEYSIKYLRRKDIEKFLKSKD